MPATPTLLTQGADTTNITSAYLTASVTPAASRPVVLVFAHKDGATTGRPPVVSGCNLTWTKLADFNFSVALTTDLNVSVFLGFGAAPTAGQITLDVADSKGGCWSVVQWADTVTTNGGLDAVKNVTYGEEAVESLSSGVTLPAFTSANNRPHGVVYEHNSGVTITPDAPMTKLGVDASHATPNRIISTAVAAEVDTTPSWTVSALGTRQMVAMEIVSAPSGTTFTKALGGTVGAAGSTRSRGRRKVVGSMAASAAVRRRGRMRTSGTATTSGTVVRRVRRGLGASLSPAGFLARVAQYRRALSGASTPSGVVLRRSRLRPVGTVAIAGSLRRRVSVALVGVVPPAGVLASRVTRIFTRLVTGTVGPSGVLARRGRRVLAGRVDPTGSLRRALRRQAAGTVTASGGLARRLITVYRQALAGSLAPSGVLGQRRMVRRLLVGTLQPAGALRRRVASVIRGSLVPTGSVSKRSTLAFRGAVSAIGTMLRDVARLFSRSRSSEPARRSWTAVPARRSSTAGPARRSSSSEPSTRSATRTEVTT